MESGLNVSVVALATAQRVAGLAQRGQFEEAKKVM